MAILLPLFLALLCCITHSNALSTISRRSFVASSPFLIASTARAADSSYTKSTDAFSYTFTPPADCEIGNKPLKTHLEEVNFSSSTTKGYQFGVTVDPVRINSLREFGTPEEVAARVVLAEVNRDGVFDVTLVKDPIEQEDQSYILNYLSQGKRGDKHFICKVTVKSNKLYVLTAQCKEENFKEKEKELFAAVDSFRV